jgi:ligand-binding sensor domain-containing protein/signal transduction histidine kinase
MHGEARPWALRLFLSLGALLIPWTGVRAEQLPARLYTIEDGLAHSGVHQTLVDSKGFIWFGTSGGVTRFDGQRFVSYGREHGLPDLVSNSVIEDREHRVWIATNGGGVARFEPAGVTDAAGRRGLFVVYPVGDEPDSNRVNRLFADRHGRLWAGTDAGLYRLERVGAEDRFVPIALDVPGRSDRLIRIFAVAESASGLWLGSTAGVHQRLESGAVATYVLPTVVGTFGSLLIDRDGRVWSGTSNGLLVFRPIGDALDASARVTRTLRAPLHGCTRPGVAPEIVLPAEAGSGCHYAVAEGLPEANIRSIGETVEGRVLLGTQTHGLAEFDGHRFRPIATGFDRFSVTWMTEDDAGTLWASGRFGALRITRRGLALFRSADGLPPGSMAVIGEDPRGALYVLNSSWQFHWLDGERFREARFNVPLGTQPSSWPELHHLLDRNGEWWVGTGAGLYRFPATPALDRLSRTAPRAVYTTRDGLPSDDIVQLFEDSRGDVWVATGLGSADGLCRWDRRENRFVRYTQADGVPPYNQVLQFAEDASGAVWIGFREHGLARYRDGRFTFVWKDLPGHRLYVDRRGSVWATNFAKGTARFDDVKSASPEPRWYTRETGLSHDFALAFAEDALGHLYLATDRAIDRLNLETGDIRRLTSADGFPAGGATLAYADRRGHVWFGSFEGVTRLTPAPERPAVAPRVLIGGLRVSGDAHPISEDGESRVEGLVLPSGQNAIEIDVFALGGRVGETFRYQFQLTGADADWGASTDQHGVYYSRLAPGAYEFRARALNSAGLVSDTPATLAFRILPPFWQRWWFLGLVTAVIASIAYGGYRYRLAQLLRVERVRARIATDLHDDIGSSLSQIAILSEVARQRSGDAAVAAPQLSRIADTSRQLVDAMGDIVWAIDPQRDSLADLTYRMRRFAADTLENKDIRFTFTAPDGNQQLKLGADLRREIFLILKESVTNIAKHSGATEATIDFRLAPSRLSLRIADNGCGFSPDAPVDGNGVASMRRRVAALGGLLAFDSAPNHGSVVTLDIDLRGRAGSA